MVICRVVECGESGGEWHIFPEFLRYCIDGGEWGFWGGAMPVFRLVLRGVIL